MERICIKLSEIGIDTDGIVSKLGGNEMVYLSICKKFIQDPNYSLFQTAISTDNIKAAGTYLHTLKGVSANLGFVSLSQLCNSMMEQLNHNDTSYMKQLCQDLSKEYYKLIEILIDYA